MSDFFTDTMTGLLQAIDIDKGIIEVEEVNDLPGTTFRVKEKEQIIMSDRMNDR